MKKALIYFIGLFFLAIPYGCEDFLTHPHPTGVTDDDWWETEANARDALGTIYDGIPGTGSHERNILLAGSCLADETTGLELYGQYTKGLQTSDWEVALQTWQGDYLSIRKANRYLENVDNVFMDEALKARYKAEARALRAYFHMELLLLYGEVPILTNSLTQDQNTASRNTEQEVYEFVIGEFSAAAEGLPDGYTNEDAWRISKPACWAFITRLALFYKQYDVVAEYAKQIIDLGQFELYPDYKGLFTYDGELNDERIFFKLNGASATWDLFGPYSLGGNSIISPTNIVVNNFETKQGKTIWELGTDSVDAYLRNPIHNNNRDQRLNATVLLPGEVILGEKLQPFLQDNQNSNRIGIQGSTATGYWVKKYLDTRDRNGARTLDLMIFRYGEVLLNYVESLVELGQIGNPDIISYLNQIRNRADMPDVDVTVYNSQEKLRELVRRERQSELAYEGQRFFDIRRWGIADEVMNGQVYGATNPETGETVHVEIRVYKPNRDVRYPIPRGETIANPNLGQNPGY